MHKALPIVLGSAFGLLLNVAIAQNKPALEPHTSDVKEHVKEPLTFSGGETILTGVVLFNYWDHTKGGGQPPLGTGKGSRKDHKHVAFGKKFSAPPRVMVAISGLDASAESSSSTRIEVYPGTVDESGFDINAITWADSRVFGVHVSWIAIGK